MKSSAYIGQGGNQAVLKHEKKYITKIMDMTR